MINLMVGCNYSKDLPEGFKILNDKYEKEGRRIAEIYGSIRDLKIFGSARPDFRVPQTSLNDFKEIIKEFQSIGISINYTENTPIVDKKKIDKKKVKDDLDLLKGLGISRLTICHPLAMELIAEMTDIPVEVSTIYRVNTIYQMRELKRRCPNINKICLDVFQNRNFTLIESLSFEAKKLGIDVEILANEFCIDDCVDRVQCYQEHAQVKTLEEAQSFKNYPMGNCTYLRNAANPVEWLRARFVLPQAMDFYKKFGIDHFKISGRTHPTKYILWVTEQYLSGNFSGNLLELWADVKNISRIAKGASDFLDTKYHIKCEELGPSLLENYFYVPNMSLDYEYEMLTKILERSMVKS